MATATSAAVAAATASVTPVAAVPAPSRGPELIIVAAALLGINVISIGTRCYTKIRISKDFGLNDIGMVTVLLTYASLLALLILGVQNGIGGHTTSATVQGIGNSLKYIWFLEIIYVTLTSIMKASVATTLRQWAIVKTHVYLLWASIVVDVIITLVFSFYIIFSCTPVSYAWTFVDPTVKGHCAPLTGQLYMGYALCITTIGLDMLFLFLPFVMLRGRGVNSRLKLYIYGIFSLGVLASFANFIRLGALVKLKASTDALFDAGPVFLWSAVEVSVGIFVAGLLELRPLMGRYGVKGFEAYSPNQFAKMADDSDMMRLQDMDKASKIGREATRVRDFGLQ